MSDAFATPKPKYILGFPFWVYILLAAAGAITCVHMVLGDRGMINGITWSILILAGVLCLLWFAFCSSFTRAIRWRLSGVAFLIVGMVVLCLRIEGFTGNLIPIVSVREWLRGWLGLTPPDALGPVVITDSSARIDLSTTGPHDFPQFLGPQRDLSVTGIKLARDWDANPPKEMWRQPIGAGWSGFVAVNGYAVTLEQRGNKELVTCYHVETGKLRWAHGSETRFEDLLGRVGPRSTPTIYQGRVYALGATGKLYCLDGATGQPVWQKDLLKEFGLRSARERELVKYGRSNSPLIFGEWVIVPAGGPEPGQRWSLAAFHQDNGAIIWKGGERNVSYSSPTFAVLAGTPQILSVNAAYASGHVPTTGAVLWEVDWPGTTSADANNSQAVPVPPDRVFLSKGYGVGAKLFKLVRKDDGALEPQLVYHKRRNMMTKFTNVTIRDGFVYGLSDGILECMELDTGRQRWREGRYGHGQILRVDELLLVLSEEGELSLVEATPDEPNKVLGTIQAVEGLTWNNLALAGPHLLLRNAREAVCYRLATDAN